MTKKIRVRFAPSPTGPLHIGGVRTALFNYLFAKKHNGDFILRIEDTDQNRYVEGAEHYIIDALNWCNIPFDEGPYRQSERKHLYQQYADELLKKGHAYYAFDTSETLDFHRKDHEKKGKTFIYNWHNRLKLKNSLSLSEAEVVAKIKTGEPYVIRFKMVEDENAANNLSFSDSIRGNLNIDLNTLDDKILFKSDGMPTYHLANVVDDYLMKISHVIRGEEWLPSLPLHIKLYKAFGWDAPEFAHLPLILKPSGKGKLSKRDGDKLGFPVFPLEWKDPKTETISNGFKEMGYFPEAIVNFLAFLGWNPKTEQELFSLGELISAFNLEEVNKAGASFDHEKIKWFNHQYLQQKSDEELAVAFLNSLSEDIKEVVMSNIPKNFGMETSQDEISPFGRNDISYIKKIIKLTKERATFASDFWQLSHYIFEAPKTYNEKAVKKQWKPETPKLMTELVSILTKIDDFSAANIEKTVKQWISDKNLGFGSVLAPFRLALVGDLKGIHVFDIAELVGKEETINRIQKAINSI